MWVIGNTYILKVVHKKVIHNMLYEMVFKYLKKQIKILLYN